MHLKREERDLGGYVERIMSKFWTRLFFGARYQWTDRLDSLQDYYEVAWEYWKTGENKEEFFTYFHFDEEPTPSELPADLIGFLEYWPQWRAKYISVFDFFTMTEREIRNWFYAHSGDKGGSKVVNELLGNRLYDYSFNAGGDDSLLSLLSWGYWDLMDRSERYNWILEKTLKELKALGLSDEYRGDI